MQISYLYESQNAYEYEKFLRVILCLVVAQRLYIYRLTHALLICYMFAIFCSHKLLQIYHLWFHENE